MEALPRKLLLLGVCAALMAMGVANAAQGETAPVVVVGLAKCSDCTRKNMNAEAAFKGLLVAVKCKNGHGKYESAAVGQVGESGAFSLPLAGDLVGEDGELKRECFTQLHSASGAPCPGQEPSKIVAAPPQGGDGVKKTFVALAGKVHHSSPECASAFLCDLHKHHLPGATHKPVVVPPKPGQGHPLPPVAKPPCTPAAPTPSPTYHSPAEHDAITEPQLFKKLIPFLKKLPFFPPAAQESKH
ncbi:hypothetical protein ACP4OV_015533 [Aristida adscensionis]